jgi:long-subunit fatty acid transport protein
MKSALAPLALLLALAACHSQPTAGGLTAEEERELDNAAAMLDQQNIFDASPDGVASNEAATSEPDNAAGASPANGSRSAQ